MLDFDYWSIENDARTKSCMPFRLVVYSSVLRGLLVEVESNKKKKRKKEEENIGLSLSAEDNRLHTHVTFIPKLTALPISVDTVGT